MGTRQAVKHVTKGHMKDDEQRAVEANGLLLCKLSVGSTAAAPDCLTTSGQVRYEITFREVGPAAQVGWATPAFQREDAITGNGTGEDEHSWAADGVHSIAGHKGHLSPYDVKWAIGDVIGVAADLDAGTLSFAKNGKWVEVFSGFDFGGAGGGLFPSITMHEGECEINLGRAPFKHAGPDDRYQPVSVDTHELVRYRGESWYFKGSFEVRPTMEVGFTRAVHSA